MLENNNTIRKITLNESDIWLSYINNKKEATVFHHPYWLNALHFETGQELFILVCFDKKNNVVGGLPLQVTKGMFFGLGGTITNRRLSALPRTPLMDVIADSDEISELLISKALEHTRAITGAIFQLKSLQVENYHNVNNIKIIPWREEYFLSLPEMGVEIRFGDGENHRKIKWAVNKAKKAGVIIKKECTFDELKSWYKLYLDTCRWHATFPRSFKFFKYLYNKFYPAGLMKMYLAVLPDSRNNQKLLAGSLLLMYSEEVFYSFNGRDKDSFQLRPNDLIQWEAIHDAQQQGYKRYHFGEVSQGQEGLAEFKKKWCNDIKQIYHIYSTKNTDLKIELGSEYSGELKRKIWRQLPLYVTQIIGNFVYSRL